MAQATEADLPSQEILRLTLKESDMPPKRARVRNEKVSKYINKVLEYSCDVCGKKFNDKCNLQIHAKTHSATYSFHCNICPYKSKVKKYLMRHIKKTHSKPTGNQCSVCGKMFHFPSKLRNHMMVHTGEKPYKCDVCGKAFNSAYSLGTHKLIHTNEKPYQCSFCEYACRDGSTLRKHQARHMGLERVYKCKMCKISCKSKWMLKNHVAEQHLEINVKNYTCDQCGKAFRLRTTLTNHIQAVHDKTKTCKCKICGYQLSNKGNLASHMRRHVDARPYRCNFKHCDKSFKARSDLSKHSVIHSPRRQHACGACGRLFARAHRRDAHAARHERRDKHVQCHHCGAAFYNKPHLAKHIERKHGISDKKYVCDICHYVTYDKPSIVMHLKYGHGHENDTKCKICNSIFKMHKYLKMHYIKSHNIRYKTVLNKKPVAKSIEIKEEPLDYASDGSIDLFEVNKQEVLDDLEDEEPNEEYENIKEYSESVMSEDIAKIIINNNRQKLNRVPEQVFDEFFIDQASKQHVGLKEKIKKNNVDSKEENHMKECIKELLSKHQKKVQTRQKLERVSASSIDLYEERKRKKMKTCYDERRRKIDSLSTANKKLIVSSGTMERISTIDKVGKRQKMNSVSTSRVKVKQVKKRQNIKRVSTAINRSKEISNGDGVTPEEELSKARTDNLNDTENSDTEDSRTKTAHRSLKFNSHQCYICFKLFPTKSKLTQHCSEHFDICTETMLKKCPICKYVTKGNLKRHMRVMHRINIDLARAKIKVRDDNTDGSRYCYEIDNGLVMELIPSVNNLNKRASTRLDKKNRNAKDKFIGTTKLVRKGNEWVVENKKLNKDGYVLPESLKEDCVTDNYLDKMKCLSQVAKRNGSKMLFPCNKCEKVCQTLSALKMHGRRHETNPKPYKPKVWKHKTKENVPLQGQSGEKVTKYKLAKPKPIVNKHKCDDKLKEFYKNNITGGDIEFWHFLKIYNKMGRENIKDFKDLERRTDFGLHVPTEETNNRQDKSGNEKCVKPKTKRVKMKKDRKAVFKRVIMLNKRDYLKRREAKNKLREKIYNEMHNKS